MKENLKLKIILGSTRKGRFSDKAGHWIAGVAKKFPELETELLDLRDYPMPFFEESATPNSKKEPYTNEAVVRWTAKIAEADAFIIVAPEYNHGYTAVLKNAIDYVGPEWHNKTIAFVAYGSVAGARSVEQLREVAVELQMAPIRSAVHIQAPWTLLGEEGKLKTGALDSHEPGAEAMLKQLIWWAQALKTARETSK